MSDFLLDLQDVHVNFPARKNWLGKVTERVHALNGLDLQIRQGETLGIVGESGCGKSTLAQLLMGMLKPSKGNYGRRGDKQHNGMQMVFQDPLSSLDPRLPVWRTITEPVWIQKRNPERERRMLAEDFTNRWESAQNISIVCRMRFPVDNVSVLPSPGRYRQSRMLSYLMNPLRHWISPYRRKYLTCWCHCRRAET